MMLHPLGFEGPLSFFFNPSCGPLWFQPLKVLLAQYLPEFFTKEFLPEVFAEELPLLKKKSGKRTVGVARVIDPFPGGP
jgi:hypothetical protein